MPNEVKLLPCVWCEGQTKRFQMKTTEGAIVEMVEHQGWPHCCVRRDSMTLAQWQSQSSVREALEYAKEYLHGECNVGALAEIQAIEATRPTTVVTDEVVERVKLAIRGDNSPHAPTISEYAATWLAKRIAKALASMPTVVTGEQPGWQPIESAPRDRWILAAEAPWEPGPYDAYAAHWHNDGYWMARCGQYVTQSPEPTHWQHLPEPPAQPGDA